MRSPLIVAAFVLLATPVFAATLDERLAPCLACHGESGQSNIAEVPSLGAQPAFYLLTQLFMFRDKLRVVTPMTEMLQGIGNDDLRTMAEAIAKLPAPRPNESPLDPSVAERAQALIQRHRCNFCHNADFSGAENAPRLAAQREDYLLTALRGYKDNTRRGYDEQMADVVEPLGDADLADLAAFLARER